MNQHVVENRRRTREVVRTGFHNSLKCSHDPAEKEAHRTYKFIVANYCWQHSIDFYTEVSFRGGGRCDLLISDWGLAIEILSSEEFKSFMKKKYPLPTIPLNVLNQEQAVLSMLDDLSTTNGFASSFYTKRMFL